MVMGLAWRSGIAPASCCRWIRVRSIRRCTGWKNRNGSKREDGRGGTRGAAGVWECGTGAGSDARYVGLGIARPADAGLAIWREDDHKVAGIRRGGDSDAGAGHWREHGAVLSGKRSAAESLAISRAGAARHAAREQAEL